MRIVCIARAFEFLVYSRYSVVRRHEAVGIPAQPCYRARNVFGQLQISVLYRAETRDFGERDPSVNRRRERTGLW